MQNMGSIFADDTYVKYDSVREAMDDAGVILSHRNATSILIWFDSLVDHLKIFNIPPWKVINRIPFINILCRKAPFSVIIERIRRFYPHLYNFYPKTFVLPDQIDSFFQTRQKDKTTYIIKPNSGSLGKGITIIKPDQESFSLSDQLLVAQEYIESYLIDNTKFDLRIYVLIASISPLRIYVYRDGLARFCSEDASHDSDYAKLTNVSFNKNNTNVIEMSKISRLISDVFPILEKNGVDTEVLWKKIDKVVALSIFSAYGFLQRAEKAFCPPSIYPRCFQVLGFDVLIDKELNPHVLEVNYRPSLDFYRGKERRMKVEMIRDAILLAAPLSNVQQIVNSRKWSWWKLSWQSYMNSNKNIAEGIDEMRKMAEKTSNFKPIAPSNEAEKNEWRDVIKKVIEISIEPLSSFITVEKDGKDDEN